MTPWTIEEAETGRERAIITALIVSGQALEGITPIYKPKYFATPFTRTVAGWCVDFYTQYGKKPPFAYIQTIFDDQKRNGLEPEQAAIISSFLGSISAEYAQLEEALNPEFEIDQARRYFEKRAMEIIKEDIEDGLESGNLEKARAAITSFQAQARVQQALGKCYTLPELMQAKFPEHKYLAGNVIAQGFNALAARMKVGKTHLGYNLSINVAMGTQFLGIYPVERGDALILDFETPESRSKEKFRDILAAQGLLEGHEEWAGRLTISPRGSWPRMGQGGVAKLEEFCKEHPNLKLVVIDTWKLFAPPRKGKDQFNYDLDYQDIGPVKTIAEKYNLCILVFMHLNKSWKGCDTPFDAFFGSTGFAAAADNLYAMTPSPGEPDAVLWGVGRYVEGFKIALEKDLDRREWLSLGDAEQFELTADQGAIYQVISEMGEASPKDIAAATGKPGNSVREMLHRMVKQGRVEKSGYGKYKIPPITPNSPITNNTPITPNSCPDETVRGNRGVSILGEGSTIRGPEVPGDEAGVEMPDIEQLAAMQKEQWRRYLALEAGG